MFKWGGVGVVSFPAVGTFRWRFLVGFLGLRKSWCRGHCFRLVGLVLDVLSGGGLFLRAWPRVSALYENPFANSFFFPPFPPQLFSGGSWRNALGVVLVGWCYFLVLFPFGGKINYHRRMVCKCIVFDCASHFFLLVGGRFSFRCRGCLDVVVHIPSSRLCRLSPWRAL